MTNRYTLSLHLDSPDDLNMIATLSELLTQGAQADVYAQSAYDAVDALFHQGVKFMTARLEKGEDNDAQAVLLETIEELIGQWRKTLETLS